MPFMATRYHRQYLPWIENPETRAVVARAVEGPVAWGVAVGIRVAPGPPVPAAVIAVAEVVVGPGQAISVTVAAIARPVGAITTAMAGAAVAAMTAAAVWARSSGAPSQPIAGSPVRARSRLPSR
jgi:hypothetical protein